MVIVLRFPNVLGFKKGDKKADWAVSPNDDKQRPLQGVADDSGEVKDVLRDATRNTSYSCSLTLACSSVTRCRCSAPPILDIAQTSRKREVAGENRHPHPLTRTACRCLLTICAKKRALALAQGIRIRPANRQLPERDPPSNR